MLDVLVGLDRSFIYEELNAAIISVRNNLQRLGSMDQDSLLPILKF